MEITYDNSLDETGKALKAFHNKYMMKRVIIFTVVYAIVMVLAVDLIIKNPSSMIGYIGLALALAMIFLQWYTPYLRRKRTLTTLAGLNQERYTAKFLPDSIRIGTEIIPEDEQTETVAITRDGIITVEDGSEAAVELAKKEEQPAQVPETVLRFGEDKLESYEDEGAFLLFVNKSLIYVFPKRCMDAGQVDELRGYFEEKAI